MGGGVFLVVIVLIVLAVHFISLYKQKDQKDYDLPDVLDREGYKHHNKLVAFLWKKQQYMNSELWEKKRMKKFLLSDFQCILCGSPDYLHVHHVRGYGKIPYEPLEDLVVLCEQCHKEEHDTHGYPETFEDYVVWNHPIDDSKISK